MRAGLSMVKDSGCGAGPDKLHGQLQLLAGQRLHVDGLQLRAASAARAGWLRERAEYACEHEPRGACRGDDSSR